MLGINSIGNKYEVCEVNYLGGGHITTRSAKPRTDFVVRKLSVAIVPKFISLYMYQGDDFSVGTLKYISVFFICQILKNTNINFTQEQR